MRATPSTLCDIFQQSLTQHQRETAFLHKVEGTYQAVSSQEFAARVATVASGLRELGVTPGARVAVLSENRLEWAIADWAILHCGAVTVPIYPTLQPATVQAMIADSGAWAAFVSNPEQAAKLGGTGDLPSLEHVILFDGGSGTQTTGRAVHTYVEVCRRGRTIHDDAAFERQWRSVRPQDLATLIYTSGTSGNSKGVMLTHANLVANILGTLRSIPIDTTDSCLSFLPLSHVLERTCGHFVMWHVGATIAYAESVEAVPKNLLEVRPTILISVPRLYEKMNGRILAAIEQAPGWRRRLFAWAQKTGSERVRLEQAGKPLPALLALRVALADRLVFAKLRARMGGRMRLMVSGGAPLSRSIAEFFHAAGLRIMEGYGLTETSPVLAINPADHPRIGTVGPPLDNVEIRIAPNGEILARGPNIMQGYWNNPAATAEAIVDGWFHTGDIGSLEADGHLRITDRLKDIIVTAGGKKVAPQPIESRLKAFQYLAEVILIGDQRKYVSAIVVPNFVNLEAWARTHGVQFASREELTRVPQVMALYEVYFGALNAELAPFERIKRIALLDRELESASGEITPSMKVKRNVIAKTFATLIDSLYAEPPAAGIGCPPTAGPAEAAAEPAPASSVARS